MSVAGGFQLAHLGVIPLIHLPSMVAHLPDPNDAPLDTPFLVKTPVVTEVIDDDVPTTMSMLAAQFVIRQFAQDSDRFLAWFIKDTNIMVTDPVRMRR